VLILKLGCIVNFYISYIVFREIFYIGYRQRKKGSVRSINAKINLEDKKYF
jgi:hypothetical protein